LDECRCSEVGSDAAPYLDDADLLWEP
jgi:hypothetical protein